MDLESAWASQPEYGDEEFRALIDSLVADAPPEVAAFERACAYDSTGSPDRAVPLYRAALAGGLAGYRRRRATIQLASSLRNLGRAAESVELLTAELALEVDPEAATLTDAARGFLALALADTGREREAVTQALLALVPHLPRYQRSLAAYAEDL
jgi:hypothetical protein